MKFLKFKDHLYESTLKNAESSIDVNDIGYHLIFDAIEEYINKSKSQIKELDSLEDFTSIEKVKNFSTAEKGNFVLTLGLSDGNPACMLLDELNDIITYYI